MFLKLLSRQGLERLSPERGGLYPPRRGLTGATTAHYNTAKCDSIGQEV